MVVVILGGDVVFGGFGGDGLNRSSSPPSMVVSSQHKIDHEWFTFGER